MLTGKQKRYLRSLASSEAAMFQIGKEALSDNLIHMVDQAFNTHELIKLRVLKTCPVDLVANESCQVIITGSEVVQIIGHTIVLYRPADEPRILLP